MEKQLLATIVVFLFCLLYTVAIAAQTNAEARDVKSDAGRLPTGASISDLRAIVQNFGFGKRVSVRLRNGSKTSGRITALAGDQFVVTDAKGAVKAIAYADVSRIARQKEKLGVFHRPWFAIMFTAAGVGTLIVVALQFFD